jgi:carbamoyl-phosphate synthase small subunit
MKYNTRPQAIVLLADGTIFYGKSVGVKGSTSANSVSTQE